MMLGRARDLRLRSIDGTARGGDRSVGREAGDGVAFEAGLVGFAAQQGMPSQSWLA